MLIGQAGLEITLTDGDGASFRWPLAEVRQTQGFRAGEQVRLERGGELAETLLVADAAFLSALRAAAPDAARAFHEPRRRRLRAGLAGVAALIAVALGGALYVWGIPAVAEIATTRVPVAWEVALGETAIAQLAPAGKRCADQERQRRIDEIAGRLVQTLPEPRYPFRVTVVDNMAVNAIATPGGFIVVFRGLLDRTDTAEELAGVLAHEIQHVLHRDATRAILRQASTGILLAALLGDIGGVRMLQAAAVDPEGMLAFFRGMRQLEGATPKAVRYLSTHPAAGDRLQALAALAAQPRPPPVKLLAGYDWEDVKKICVK